MASIKNNEEIANLLTDGLVCLCGSYRGIYVKLKQFQNQFKVPSSIFKEKKQFITVQILMSDLYYSLYLSYLHVTDCWSDDYDLPYITSCFCRKFLLTKGQKKVTVAGSLIHQ